METSIKQIIQAVCKTDMPTIVIGTVAQVEPLQIILVNDINVILSAMSVTIPDRLAPIKQDDSFYLLSFDSNKSYYALDRV